nr:uncharacterized protein CI109_007448 [Kwoniella shandongensis]KAA5524223.1 hypothetical protein CI109_007448 [Kwoniella shandongensis]
MRIARNVRRLAVAGSNPAVPSVAISKPFAQSSRQAHSTAVNDAENFGSPSFTPGHVLSTVPPPQRSSKLDTPHDFFRPSQPFPKSQSALPTAPENHNETDLLRQMRELLALPASSRDQWRATQIWRLYRTLSPAFRRSLDIYTLQNVFQSVLPNTFFVQKITGPIEAGTPENRKLRLRKHKNLGEKWERRLRTVAADMMAAQPDRIDPRVFVKPLSKLAMLGEKTGCEEIIREIRYRYDGSSKVHVSPKLLRQMYNSGLQSVSRWLNVNAHRWRSAQGDIAEAIEVTRRLVAAMQESNIPPSPLTADSLLNTARFISATSTDRTTRDAFDRLTEMILTEGYGVKQDELKSSGSHPEISSKNPVRMAVVDLLGRKGDLFGMVAASDAIFADAESKIASLSTLPENEVTFDVEEEIPTLSSMLAAEQAQRAETGWFGRKASADREVQASTVAESEDPLLLSLQDRRRFADFLSPIPSPNEVLLIQSAVSDDITTRLRTKLQELQSPAHWSALTTSENAAVHAMLSRTWLAKDKVGPSDTSYKLVSLHILRVALRAAHAEQSRWISELMSNDITPRATKLPSLSVDPNWFRAVWRTIRHTRSGSARGAGYAPAILEELEEAVRRITQEQDLIAEALERMEVQSKVESNKSGPTVTPTEAFDVTGHLERLVNTRESLDEVREMIGQQVELAMASRAKVRQAERVKKEERKAQMNAKREGRLGGRLLRASKVHGGDEAASSKWAGAQPALA